MLCSRPILSAELFDIAVASSSLTAEEEEMIDFVRCTGVIDELSIRKGLSLPSKPPSLCLLANICEKVGSSIPDHFQSVMNWSKTQSSDGIAWKGNLICAIAFTSDGVEISPNAGTSLYFTFVVHKELFVGLG
tara:strand:- start:115 stop:513 length:399 start_codon:yes stop_codon:yes gene_type:complete